MDISIIYYGVYAIRRIHDKASIQLFFFLLIYELFIQNKTGKH